MASKVDQNPVSGAPQADVHHSQKLESIGRLAAGIAHEINTPVQFIGDSVFFLREAFETLQGLLLKYSQLADAVNPSHADLVSQIRQAEDEAELAYLHEQVPNAMKRILEGVSRVTGIVRSMKEFAHPDTRLKALADINRALENALALAKNEYKYVATAEADLNSIPLVNCHIGDLNQVFLNLILNAAHAIEEVVKGTDKLGQIKVKTWFEKESVFISIHDNGCGIPVEIRERIFEPFFTTKPVGKGTGQGLPIVRSIVEEKHGGSVALESTVGFGTTFLIRLPVEPAPTEEDSQ